MSHSAINSAADGSNTSAISGDLNVAESNNQDTSQPFAATVSGGPFYAYIRSYRSPKQIYKQQAVITFASRNVADEWWRAISTTNDTFLQNTVKRITPQLYTFQHQYWNIIDSFFYENDLEHISSKFLEMMDIHPIAPGKILPIIPAQYVVDHSSGAWFSIRSMSNSNEYWYYQYSHPYPYPSQTRRSAFRITAVNLSNGTIMIDMDDIRIFSDRGCIQVANPGSPSALQFVEKESDATIFKFGDLQSGRFSTNYSDNEITYSRDTTAGVQWELVAM